MLEKIMAFAVEAGKLALSAHDGIEYIEKEGRANYVTEYDKRIQDLLRERLSSLCPCAGFLGEEGDDACSYDGHDEWFVIDPIDGTTNFIRGSAAFCVCIGLADSSGPKLGVVHAPKLCRTYIAERGNGAFIIQGGEKQHISVSKKSLDGAIVAFGTSPYDDELMKKSFSLALPLLERAADIRRSGSAALDICLVAQGVYDLMFECRLQPWDHVAAGAILTEAGGVASDFEGKRLDCVTQTPFVCGNPSIQKDFLKIVGLLENK